VYPRLLILPPAGQGILTLQWVTFGDLAVDADSGKWANCASAAGGPGCVRRLSPGTKRGFGVL